MRKDIVGFFESGTFPYKGNVFKIKEEESKEQSKEERIKKLIEYIEKESKDISYDLFKTHFNVLTTSVFAKKNL